MGTTLSCFVAKNDREVHDDKTNDIMKSQCFEFEFDLELRRFKLIGMPRSRVIEPRHWMAAHDFFDLRVGTPEKLMKFVKTTSLSKAGLAKLLIPEVGQTFLTVCAVLEKEATDSCGSSGDTCLEDGCAFEGTEDICLNAVLLSEGKCLRACTDIWVKTFENPENRIDVWRS